MSAVAAPTLVTVMTDPAPEGRWLAGEWARRAARRARDLVRPRPVYARSRFRGHFAVTRSLVEGLGKIGVDCRYNPQSVTEVGDVVVVLANLRALKQAIEWKRRGRISRLLAGPNLVILPSDAMELIAAPEIDVYLVNSPWTLAAYLADCPDLQGRCMVWASGVDTGFWKPIAARTGHRALVFDKLPPGEREILAMVLSCLGSSGYEARRMAYGSFTAREYLSELQSSTLLVGLSPSESQGLAWAEAWAVNIPTLIHARDHHWNRGKRIGSSPAPYLTAATGSLFSSIEDLRSLLVRSDAGWKTARPREWVLAHMSDEVSAMRLCELAGVEARARGREVGTLSDVGGRSQG